MGLEPGLQAILVEEMTTRRLHNLTAFLILLLANSAAIESFLLVLLAEDLVAELRHQRGLCSPLLLVAAILWIKGLAEECSRCSLEALLIHLTIGHHEVDDEDQIGRPARLCAGVVGVVVVLGVVVCG